MLDDTNHIVLDTEQAVLTLGALPVAPMYVKKQQLQRDVLPSAPGFLSRVMWIFAAKPGH